MRFYFCKAFAALKTEVSAEDRGRYDTNAIYTSTLSDAARQDLLDTLSSDTERLMRDIDPVLLGRAAEAILFGPPRCHWCYHTDVHTTDASQFATCEICSAAQYCSTGHKESAMINHRHAHGASDLTEVCHSILLPSHLPLTAVLSVISCGWRPRMINSYSTCPASRILFLQL